MAITPFRTDFPFSAEINGRLPNPLVLPFIHCTAATAVIPLVHRLIKGIIDSFIPKQRPCTHFRFKHYFDNISFKSGVHSCSDAREQLNKGHLQLKSVFRFLLRL